jgi:hypothetical protein
LGEARSKLSYEIAAVPSRHAGMSQRPEEMPRYFEIHLLIKDARRGEIYNTSALIEK